MKTPSYHDLYITTKAIERTSIFDLPFGFMLTCTRAAGWELWNDPYGKKPSLVAGEYDTNGLRLDVAGHIIVDSLA
jgi:hypothetical protein